VTVQAQILDLISDLQQEYDSAVIIITHDLGVVAELADDILVMYAGRMAEYGSSEDIFLHPGHPYTWGLLGRCRGWTAPGRTGCCRSAAPRPASSTSRRAARSTRAVTTPPATTAGRRGRCPRCARSVPGILSPVT